MSEIFGVAQEKMQERSAVFTLTEIYRSLRHGRRHADRLRSIKTRFRNLLTR